MLGYSAFNIAIRDLSSGSQFLTDLRPKYHPEFLSANIFYKGSEKHYFRPFVIKEIYARGSDRKLAYKKISIGLIGLCDESSTLIPRSGEESVLESKSPLAVAKALVPEVRKKSDLVVILFSGRMPALQEILEQVTGIDVVILGNSGFLSTQIQGRQNTVIVTTPTMGKYAGTLILELDNAKKIVSSQKLQHALSEDIKDDPTLSSVVKECEAASDKLETSIRAGTAKSTTH